VALAEQLTQAPGAEIGSRYGDHVRTRFPPTWCSRYNVCSVNLCPLDPDIDKRTSDPDDPETVCRVSKPDRKRFVARMPPEMQALLPFGGLLRSEFNRSAAARLRYSRLSDSVKARMASNLTLGRRATTAATTEAVTHA
jgi:hypothetical protein